MEVALGGGGAQGDGEPSLSDSKRQQLVGSPPDTVTRMNL